MTSLQTAEDRKVICDQANDWSFGDKQKDKRKEQLKKRANAQFDAQLRGWVNASNVTSLQARQSSIQLPIIFVDNEIVEQWKNALLSRGYQVNKTTRRFEVRIP